MLAGGRSRRMGTAKAALEWHGSTLLHRTCALVARGADGPVVVVRAPGQELPALPDGVEVRDDPAEGLGPLQGLAVGLAAAGELGAGTAFVCSTDLPLLHVAFVRAVLRALTDDSDVAVPYVHDRREPLAAAYRTVLADRCRLLLDAGQRRPAALLDAVRTRHLDEAALRSDPRLAAADPLLESLLDVDDVEEYRAVRARPAPLVTVERFGVLARSGTRGPQQVRAADVAGAARAVGLPLDRTVLAAVNGDTVGRRGESPLVAGDTVAFLSADAGG